ncbi:MAG TPA: ribosomal protein S18-alanine N-acetyltransferase [Candidatus Binatus sp.]|uniref:ribosomal protein S18-alanine N-acetyltransferase n=1 Tax=Candidatus Binatus sp. TaxID=2811406 RepID=UPI002B487E64|nr:ribosomal protein S18-alanine N-acetyltransferase [Candidatus Binatus sp.]HKN12454.1 ribosomal protein S18-alanine N-acetyltransferase [Candidatus Binatus sp.]
MAIHIRNATERDLPRIIEIEQLAFPAPWTLASFQRELTLPFSRIMVALPAPSGQIAGFLCRWLIADECHILNIAVHPDSRRLGIGTVLLAEAINEAKSTGANVVTLEVRRSNLAARQLYRKFDFEERRLRRHYYGPGEDAIIMELRFD